MLLKKHEANHKLVLALCDDDIAGKTFREDGRLLDLASEFYKGEPTAIDEIENLLKKAHLVNAAGDESTAMLVKLDIIGKEDIKQIQGIPTAQVILKW